MDNSFLSRGKRIDTGEWVYGSYLEQYHSSQRQLTRQIWCWMP